jgi:hypothetical protein
MRQQAKIMVGEFDASGTSPSSIPMAGKSKNDLQTKTGDA